MFDDEETVPKRKEERLRERGREEVRPKAITKGIFEKCNDVVVDIHPIIHVTQKII